MGGVCCRFVLFCCGIIFIIYFVYLAQNEVCSMLVIRYVWWDLFEVASLIMDDGASCLNGVISIFRRPEHIEGLSVHIEDRIHESG